MNTARKGREGEDYAAEFFSRRGYGILARNFRRGRGEIDLIVRGEDGIVFVEVKHWTAYGADAMEQAIDTGKARKIVDAAKMFMAENPGYEDCGLRFDVLFVTGPGEEAVHYRDVFREGMGSSWFG